MITSPQLAECVAYCADNPPDDLPGYRANRFGYFRLDNLRPVRTNGEPLDRCTLSGRDCGLAGGAQQFGGGVESRHEIRELAGSLSHRLKEPNALATASHVSCGNQVGGTEGELRRHRFQQSRSSDRPAKALSARPEDEPGVTSPNRRDHCESFPKGRWLALALFLGLAFCAAAQQVVVLRSYVSTNFVPGYIGGPKVEPLIVNGVMLPQAVNAVAVMYPPSTNVVTNYVLGYLNGTNRIELLTATPK